MSQDTNKIAEQVGRVHVGELGSYSILESIGAGGMGSVALGEVVENGRRVALKFLHEELAEEGSSSRDRFEREIRVLQDLKAFRGIVQIEDWGRTDDGILFLVMEYVSAPTLDKIIEQNPQGLSQIRGVQIVTEILSVLEPIHHRKFIHRDLKPHNICVYEDPLAVRLLDFGLSKPFTEGLGYDKVTRRMQGKGSEIPGSPHYMAVEQFLRPKEVDERTDLYAVGIILYELLAGIPPFRGIYLQDILRQHKETEPPPIDNCADGGPISYRLQAVVDKALAKKQESRYQSAGEFKEALFDVLNMLNKQRRPRKSLDGRYRILRKIGQGGNSEVFEAEKLDDSSRAALKIAREGSSDWDEETLMNEADRALNHENIVKVIEFGEFEGRPALVMELLEGGTLEDILKQYEDDGLPENIFYRSMIDICRGLHHAHQSNIVHRDVKPGNMLRTVEGKSKVCDFGIAKRFEQSGDEIQGAKNTTLAKGTAQYISPEQCDLQGRVDRRADVYCLGVMMYEMLAGVLPFTEGILIMQHLQMDPPPLLVKGSYRNPDALARVVERAMQKDPAKRFQSMKELAQELVRVSKLEPQEKSHKAVVLHTVPEEWKNDPARGGVAPTTRMETAGSGPSMMKIVAVAVPLLIVVVVAIVFGLGGNDDRSNTDPNGDGSRAGGNGALTNSGPSPDELANDEAKSLRAFVDAGNWDGFKAAELDHLMQPQGDRYRTRVLDDLGAAARTALGEVPADASDVAGRLAELATIGECADRIEKGCQVATVLNAFVKEARVLEKEPAADGDGWIGFDDATFATARKAVSGLKGGFESRKGAWEVYIDGVERDRFSTNVAALTRMIERVTGSDATAVARLRELESRSPGGAALDDVFAALTGWTTRSMRAIAAIPTRFVFVGTTAAGAAGVTGEELLALVRRLRPSARRAPANAGEAVARGILDCENDESILVAVKNAITLDPHAWSEAEARVAALGIPTDSFAPVIARAAATIFDDPGFAAAVMASAPSEAAAMGAYADEMDRRLAALYDFCPLSSAAKATADARWNAATSSLRVGNEEVEREAISNAIAAWKAAPSHELDDLVPLFSEMNRFVGRHSGETAKTVRTEAAALLDDLENRGLFLTQIVLLRLSPALLAESVASARVKAAKSAFVTVLTESPDENLGIVGPCNAEWAATTDRCIVVKYLLPAAEASLFEDGDISVTSSVGEASIVGNELKFTASPAQLRLDAKKSGGPLEIRYEIAISSKRHGLTDEAFALNVRGPDGFDFEPPELRPSWGARPTGDGWVITAEVLDDSPPDGGFSPKLTINGQEKAARKGADGKSSWALTLEDLAKDGASDEIRMVVADAFENSTAVAADRRDVERARRDLIVFEDRAIAASFGESADELKAAPFSSTAVSRATGWIEKGRRRLAALAAYDKAAASRQAEDLVGINLGVVMRAWMTGDLSTSALEGASGEFDKLIAAVRDVESDFGIGAKESNQWRGEYAQKIDDARRGATPRGDRDPPDFPPIEPRKRDWEDYEKGATSIDVAGLTLLKVDGGRDGPAWVSTVEVSKGFAQQYFPGAVRAAENEARSSHKRLKWKLENDMPLVPLTPTHVEDALAALRQSLPADRFSAQCGGPVEWDIPTRAQWQGAGDVHTGGAARKFAWGGDEGVGGYDYRSSGDSRAGWYDGLRSVDSDRANGVFHFLSGNAWEIVRSRFGSDSHYRIGGSMFEACDTRSYRYLELDSKGKSQPKDSSERFTGFRLALIATTK